MAKRKPAGLSALPTPFIDNKNEKPNTNKDSTGQIIYLKTGRPSVCLSVYDSIKLRLPCAKAQLLHWVTFIFYQPHGRCQTVNQGCHLQGTGEGHELEVRNAVGAARGDLEERRPPHRGIVAHRQGPPGGCHSPRRSSHPKGAISRR